MFFENYYIHNSSNLIINSITSYKNIMNKFSYKFISKKYMDYSDKNKLYNDALIYSKYYLYWKTINCIYKKEIMNILYDIEYEY